MLNTCIFQGAITREVIHFLMYNFVWWFCRDRANAFDLRKIDLKLFFCYISQCNFLQKMLIYLICDASKCKIKISSDLYDYCKHFAVWKNEFNGHFGPLRDHNPFLKNSVLLFNHTSINTNKSLEGLFFDFNRLNGRYLYPLIQGLKRKNTL